MTWLYSAVVPMAPGHFDPQDPLAVNTFRAILQETLGTFVFVFFFLTQTEQTIMLSKEEAINCFVIASGYCTARVLVYGQLPILPVIRQISTYGACLNPAIALSVAFNALLTKNVSFGDSFKYAWLYPLFPFAGSILAFIFYEYVFKKAREMCNKPAEDASDGGSDGKQEYNYNEEGENAQYS